MKNGLKYATLMLSFLLGIGSSISSQNTTPTIESIYNKDFIFRVLAVNENVIVDWEPYDYVIAGHVDYRTNGKNELKIFFKESTITYEFEPISEIFTEVNESGQTVKIFAAKAINVKTGINCMLGILSYPGTDQFILAIGSPDSKWEKSYAIKYGF